MITITGRIIKAKKFLGNDQSEITLDITIAMDARKFVETDDDNIANPVERFITINTVSDQQQLNESKQSSSGYL